MGQNLKGKTARLTETHTFEVRAARIKLDGLFFSNSDEKPNEQTILRKTYLVQEPTEWA